LRNACENKLDPDKLLFGQAIDTQHSKEKKNTLMIFSLRNIFNLKFGTPELYEVEGTRRS